ncbi:MAG: Antitoxin [Chloroflexi bacterium]|nr:Antitoxin [Chloroflexota bacterium]
MAIRIPSIRTISDLTRDARALVAEARTRQEPIVITRRGREVAVLLPTELYRRLESQAAPRIASPRLAQPQDAGRFTMTMTVNESPSGAS